VEVAIIARTVGSYSNDVIRMATQVEYRRTRPRMVAAEEY
jgi:hypothetical protein